MTKLIVYWIAVIGLQVLLLNHLDFSAYLVPQVFIVLLISLPLHLSRTNQVLLAFGLGLIIDFFVSTPGIHASGCMFLVLIRFFILSNQDLGQHAKNKLSYNVKNVGVPYFMSTTIVLVFFYHFYVFWIERIGAINMTNWLVTSAASASLSITVIVIIQYLSIKSAK